MSIDGFWDIGPHETIPVEESMDRFIKEQSGIRISEIFNKTPEFSNADYWFEEEKIVIELKEIETEFLHSQSAKEQFFTLLERLKNNELDMSSFHSEYIRIARPALGRVLKKANKQLKETKEYLRMPEIRGCVVIVNDGFTSLAHDLVMALLCSHLKDSYKSIDSLIYLTINRYVEIQGSDEPKLIWAPVYRDENDDHLVDFVDQLGKKWFDFLEEKLGSFTSRISTDERDILINSHSILLPSEERY
ncbi:hypothetical protein NYR66_10840 [Actinobacillus equuli subsp. haemolyticus]|uniref:hypothetical protein n=1 Tax=Actinobacillus equuli TaxID=718 RepID=UPI002441D00D|nr:hypothetical protein [Actinobacillus equuli]WGE81398.1 hypothetical protein NYR66_10840 [Actinobacillus equuli subsp. haemolyticus]